MTSSAFVPAHLLVAYLIFVQPVRGVLQYRALTKSLASGNESARLHFYRKFVLRWWASVFLLGFVLILLPFPLGATLREMGLRVPRNWMIVGSVFLGVIVAELIRLVIWRKPTVRAKLLKKLERFRALLPVTKVERHSYLGFAITAGVCEELVYRGFLLFYFLQIFQDTIPFEWGIVFSAVVFGLAHCYQGLRGVLATGLIGIFFAYLYWYTGSLFPSMVTHALMDLRFLFIRDQGINQTSSSQTV